VTRLKLFVVEFLYRPSLKSVKTHFLRDIFVTKQRERYGQALCCWEPIS